MPTRFCRQFCVARPYTPVMQTNVTDAMLREAWTAALNHRGRRDAIFDRINEILDEAKRMPDEERRRQRRIALAMLQEVRPH